MHRNLNATSYLLRPVLPNGSLYLLKLTYAHSSYTSHVWDCILLQRMSDIIVRIHGTLADSRAMGVKWLEARAIRPPTVPVRPRLPYIRCSMVAIKRVYTPTVAKISCGQERSKQPKTRKRVTLNRGLGAEARPRTAPGVNTNHARLLLRSARWRLIDGGPAA